MTRLIDQEASEDLEVRYPQTFAGEAWELEVNRNSREFIRWIQQSLNTVQGSGLAVDGAIGPATRAAIKSFQGSQRLVQDGVVGPNTEAALKSALALRQGGVSGTSISSPTAVLDRFAFDKDDLQPHHGPILDDLARRIVAAHRTSSPVRSVRIVGFTDASGSEAYNLDLGRRRAERVAAALKTSIQRFGPSALANLIVVTESRGEAQTTPDPARSRRCEVFLAGGSKRKPDPKPASRLNPARWTSIMADPTLRTGNVVDFLVDGSDTFKAMLDAIRTATAKGHYIYLLGWWLTDDFAITGAPGTKMRELLKAASDKGVQVRAMLWDQAFSSQNTAEVSRINALPNGAAILDAQTHGTFLRVKVGSHHQKVLVVRGSKGLISFCGGIDINPDRIKTSGGSGSGSGSGSISFDSAVSFSSGSSGGKGNPLHDVHCRVVGPSAHDLLTTFIKRWDAHPGHAALDRAKGDLVGRKEAMPRPISGGGSSGTTGNCAVRVTRTFNPVAPVAPGSVKERTIRTTLIAAIKNARKFIYMEEQYLINMEAAALLNAALSHIEHLTIVIPHSSITDMPRVWEGRLKFIERVKRGPNGHKARVFFLFSPPLARGKKPTFGAHTYVHAKTWVFDDELAVIGSANCNQRGWTNDSEVNALIFESKNPSGQTFAQRLRMRLWSEHLNTPASSLTDGVASLSKWTSLPAGARVLPYNPREDTDGFFAKRVPWGVVDPQA